MTPARISPKNSGPCGPPWAACLDVLAARRGVGPRAAWVSLRAAHHAAKSSSTPDFCASSRRGRRRDGCCSSLALWAILGDMLTKEGPVHEVPCARPIC